MSYLASRAARPRGLRADAWRFVRPDCARFLKPGTDPRAVFPALATDPRHARDAVAQAARTEREGAAFAAALAQERTALAQMRSELLRIKSDLAFGRFMAAVAALKYSPSQLRVPGGHGRESGRWTSGDYGSGGRPRVVIDTTTFGDDGPGDAGAGSDAGFDGADGGSDQGFNGDYDGADANPGFDDPGESYDNHDLAYDAPGDRVDLGDFADRAPSRGERRTGDDSSRRDSAPSDVRSPINDSRIVSDADPEPVRPGEQYAQARGSRRGGPGSETPAQQARLSIAQARANEAINRARELDPTWSPRQSFENTIEGRISRYEGEAREAQQRINELTGVVAPGRSAGRSIADPGRRLNSVEQRQLNEIMSETGCHRCGIRFSGTSSGNAIPDHQPPTALNPPGQPQRLFPHCATCSSSQGGFISGITGRSRR